MSKLNDITTPQLIRKYNSTKHNLDKLTARDDLNIFELVDLSNLESELKHLTLLFIIRDLEIPNGT